MRRSPAPSCARCAVRAERETSATAWTAASRRTVRQGRSQRAGRPSSTASPRRPPRRRARACSGRTPPCPRMRRRSASSLRPSFYMISPTVRLRQTSSSPSPSASAMRRTSPSSRAARSKRSSSMSWTVRAVTPWTRRSFYMTCRCCKKSASTYTTCSPFCAACARPTAARGTGCRRTRASASTAWRKPTSSWTPSI